MHLISCLALVAALCLGSPPPQEAVEEPPSEALASAFDAIGDDDVDRVRSLLEGGLAIDAVTERSRATLLHRAAGCGARRCVNVLLKAGANVEAVDALGETPLHPAARYGDREVLWSMLLARDKSVRDEGLPTSLSGWTPLHWAAAEGHPRCVNALSVTKSWADLRESTTGLGQTALHLAARGGHTDTVLMLLHAGFDADAPDLFCLTAADHHGEASRAMRGSLEVGTEEHLPLEVIPASIRPVLARVQSDPSRFFWERSFGNPFPRPKGLIAALWDDGLFLLAQPGKHTTQQVVRIGVLTPARVERLFAEIKDTGFTVLPELSGEQMFVHSRERMGLRLDDESWHIHEQRGGGLPAWGMTNQIEIILRNAAGSLDVVRNPVAIAALRNRTFAPAERISENPWEDWDR